MASPEGAWFAPDDARKTHGSHPRFVKRWSRRLFQLSSSRRGQCDSNDTDQSRVVSASCAILADFPPVVPAGHDFADRGVPVPGPMGVCRCSGPSRSSPTSAIRLGTSIDGREQSGARRRRPRSELTGYRTRSRSTWRRSRCRSLTARWRRRRVPTSKAHDVPAGVLPGVLGGVPPTCSRLSRSHRCYQWPPTGRCLAGAVSIAYGGAGHHDRRRPSNL